jgi:hypothetical protein
MNTLIISPDLLGIIIIGSLSILSFSLSIFGIYFLIFKFLINEKISFFYKIPWFITSILGIIILNLFLILSSLKHSIDIELYDCSYIENKKFTECLKENKAYEKERFVVKFDFSQI